jgi:hypothetical protein
MRTPRRPSRLAALRLLAALAVGGGAFSVYLMACDLVSPVDRTGPGLAITTAPSLPGGGVGSIYCSASAPPCVNGLALAFMASGGKPPYTWTHPASSNPLDILPFGLTLAQNGYLAGTPTTAGTYTFTVKVTDDQGNTGSASFTVTIGGGVLTITPTSLPVGTVGALYDQRFGVLGGTGPSTWTEIGALPPGLTFYSGGELAGTPTQTGTFTFDALVTDAATPPNAALQAYTVNIGDQGAAVLVVQPNTLTFTTNQGVVPAPQTEYVTATGPTASGLSATIVYGPPATGWLSIGNISGASTPAQAQVNVIGTQNYPAGTYSATVTISSTPGVAPASFTVNLVVIPPLTITTQSPLPTGTVGSIYSGTTFGYQFMATGGTQPLS